MRYIKFHIVLLLIFSSSVFFGQNEFENDTYKFWQPNTKLIYKDFQSDTTKIFNEFNQKFGMQASAYCVIKSILDVPKKKRERGKKLEKIYIAPCIDKTKSISITTDSFEIAKQQLFFDISELYARKARKQLLSLRDTTNNAYGVYWSFYSRIISDMCIKKNKMADAYIEEVYIYQIEGAYIKWRKIVDDLLNDTKEFATKSEDCYRFLYNRPLSKDYKMSPDYLGRIRCNE